MRTSFPYSSMGNKYIIKTNVIYLPPFRSQLKFLAPLVVATALTTHLTVPSVCPLRSVHKQRKFYCNLTIRTFRIKHNADFTLTRVNGKTGYSCRAMTLTSPFKYNTYKLNFIAKNKRYVRFP